VIFGREPVLWYALLTAILQVANAFMWDWSTEQQGLVNAGIAAVLGLAAALTTIKERIVPAAVGLLQSVVSIAVGFGANIAPEQQSMIMAVIAAAAALFVRQQVLAPVDENLNSR
jgi:hypothetical protein